MGQFYYYYNFFFFGGGGGGGRGEFIFWEGRGVGFFFFWQDRSILVEEWNDDGRKGDNKDNKKTILQEKSWDLS